MAEHLEGEASMKVCIVWLRRELRVRDNYLLQRANELGHRVLPLYIFDPREGPSARGRVSQAPRMSAFRAQFQREAVENLGSNLKRQGSDLLICSGLPAQIIPTIAKSMILRAGREEEATQSTPDDEASKVHVNVVCAETVCWEEQETERGLEQALKAISPTCSLHKVWDLTLYDPDDVNKATGLCWPADMPDGGTGFRKAVEQATVRKPLNNMQPMPLPRYPSKDDMYNMAAELEACGVRLGLPTLEQLGCPPLEDPDPRAVAAGCFTPKGGEDTGLSRAQQYIFNEDRLKTYFKTRNGSLGQGFSTKLAPWLAHGCVSPRFIHSERLRYEQERGISTKSTYWLTFELIVRDYFTCCAHKWGRRLFFPYGVVRRNGAKWVSDPSLFEAWRDGVTGVPLIDAHMRELGATGYMSNRGRQNVASFLSLDLCLDWRMGAEHFEALLTDYSPELNWANWLSAAALKGGRTNRFNPVKQGKRYDPNGDHIKAWCPELARVPPEHIHAPWLMTAQEQEAAGCVIGKDYPAPIKTTEFWYARPQHPQQQPLQGKEFGIAPDLKDKFSSGPNAQNDK